MNVYVDFDDVVSETAKYFCDLLPKYFGKTVPYEDVKFFNLKKSFDLCEADYRRMMEIAHREEELLVYRETEGAAEVLDKWMAEGHNVQIVTGRPYSSRKGTEKWLDAHGLKNMPIVFVDKYGREQPLNDDVLERALTVEEFAELEFDFAVEDSPAAFEHLKKIDGCTVAVFSRPWNEDTELDGKTFVRCRNWKEIDSLFSSLEK